MLEIKRTSWQENFNETCQDILEDAFLLDALSQYVTSDGSFMHGERAQYFPQVFSRLSGSLSQHAFDLHCLQNRQDSPL